MQKWYALYTNPRAEKKVRHALDAKGIENYLPLLKKRKKWSDRYKWVEEPLFASYIFVKIDLENQHLTVLKLPHAVQFVSTEKIPAEISDADIELLKVSVENYAVSLVVRDTHSLQKGERVRVVDGPFAGKIALVERALKKATVVIVFEALKKVIEVEIGLDKIEKVGIE